LALKLYITLGILLLNNICWMTFFKHHFSKSLRFCIHVCFKLGIALNDIQSSYTYTGTRKISGFGYIFGYSYPKPDSNSKTRKNRVSEPEPEPEKPEKTGFSYPKKIGYKSIFSSSGYILSNYFSFWSILWNFRHFLRSF